MKRILKTTGLLAALLVAFASGYFVGVFDGKSKHAVEEFKICHSHLAQDAEKLAPQTKEYMKERLYWNAAVWIEPKRISSYRFDFGPVDVSLLGAARGIKDDSTSEEIYRDAMTIHGQNVKYPLLEPKQAIRTDPETRAAGRQGAGR
jgi:hypothetical protein